MEIKLLYLEALKNDLSVFNLSDLDGKVKIISVVPSVDTSVVHCKLKDLIKRLQILKMLTSLPFLLIYLFALGRFCGANGIENSTSLSSSKELDFGLKYGFAIEELRLLTRGIVVIDKDNTIKHIEYVPEITNHPDYDKAIKVFKIFIIIFKIIKTRGCGNLLFL